MRVFGAGAASQLELAITWRSGKRSVLKDARPNCVYEIDEAAATLTSPSRPAVVAPLFEDVSSRLKHIHVDALFDDFARQPLLPHKISTLGPGVCWADADRDGFDDLLIGGGNRGRPVVFRNNRKGGLTEWADAPVPKANPRDQTSVLVWHGVDGVGRLLAGESNWEDGDTNARLPCALQVGGPTTFRLAFGVIAPPPVRWRSPMWTAMATWTSSSADV
jgi:hypothetical protein